MGFRHERQHVTGIDDSGHIIQLAAHAQRQTDYDDSRKLCGLAADRVQRLQCALEQRFLQEQVAAGIAGQAQLGERDELRAFGSGPFASFTISEVLYAQSAACRSGVAAAILINPSRIGDAPSSGIVQIELVYLFLRVYAREMPSEENLCTHKTGYAKRASGMLFPSEELPPAGGGSSPYPRRGAKRVDTYGFYPLDSRFPLFFNLTQTRDRRPLRNGERQRSFSTVWAHSVRPFL